ncbi:MAG: hypothetical protein JSS75_11255 [Bacteroidetes bacterium]|nr:hypothetical protein [Bacteroidota bacterium]
MKTSEAARAAMMGATVVILSQFEGWNKLIAIGALFALAFVLRLFLPKQLV